MQTPDKKVPEYIVSLTSYEERLTNTVPYAIVTLFQQSVLPDRIVLWVSHEDKKNIPPVLRELEEKGLEIRFCEDVKLYKKLIPSLQEFPDDCIITADDNVYYPENWFEQLITLHKENPKKIICHRAHGIKIDKNHNLLPYKKWDFCIEPNTYFAKVFVSQQQGLTRHPLEAVFPTSVGGILYPPGSLHKEVTNKKLFTELAPYADDIWYWAMAVINKEYFGDESPYIVIPDGSRNVRIVDPKTGQESLKVSDHGDENDKYLKAVAEHFPQIKEYLYQIVTHQGKADKVSIFVPEKLVPAYPLEHYYSPFPALADIINHDFSFIPTEIPGVDLNTQGQLDLLNHFDFFYKEIPFKDEKTSGLRYFFKNNFYSYSDAIFLYCMLRHAKPQKIIEVGSGFSSCVTLDTNELFFNNTIECIFEPYPDRLKSLLKKGSDSKIKIYESKLQDIPLSMFTELKENDILFIDSTHVTKFKSDVNYIIHRILPILSNGVYIHFHDIFYPFEYPKEWLIAGRAWNEQYILRAFLQYNANFKIVLFNTYLETMFSDELKRRFPLIFKNIGGSIWIKKCMNIIEK
jgi:hypothetical protein